MVAGAAVNNASRLKVTPAICLLSAAAPIANGDVFFNFDFQLSERRAAGDPVAFALSRDLSLSPARRRV